MPINYPTIKGILAKISNKIYLAITYVVKRTYFLFRYVIKRILILVEILLSLRLILKFLGASQDSIIVDLVYKGSDFIVSPFKFIFEDIYWLDFFVETSTVSAMVGYALAVIIIFQLLKFFSED